MSQLSKHLLPVNKELKRKLWPENFQEELKMNEHFKKLAEQCTETWTSYFDGRGNVTTTTFDKEKFAELIYKDIITVVAAQALLNESALDVFKNLKRLYEGVEE